MKQSTLKIKKIIIASVVLINFCSTSVFSQEASDHKPCATNEMLEKAFRENPSLKADFEAREAILQQEDKRAYRQNYRQMRLTSSAPTYIIPVVFHIVHDYGAENISDAQILDEMRILNLDYRKLNPDTSAVDSVFKSVDGDTKIEFRLARLDPNGQCTSGIDRIPSMETYIGSESSKLNDWPSNKYLNVWVVKTIGNGAAGYAYLPGTCPPANDGIIILSSYIGSIGTSSPTTSRALTHEIGHFLNLQHTWGSTNQPGVSCGDDGVSDTPVTEGWNHCPGIAASKLCNPNIEENYQNFMDYSYCSHMFTWGQAARMTSALNSSTAQRNNLWTAGNLAATGVSTPYALCPPKMDIIPDVASMVCEGGNLSFKATASNGQPTVWSWSFPGGTPSTSPDSMPTIQYNTAGTYSVSLTAGNSAGSGNAVRNNYVIVNPAATKYTANIYFEGFESSTTYQADWTMLTSHAANWSRSASASFAGSASLRLANGSAMKGEIASAVSPTFDLVNIQQAVLTFKVAFAQKATGNSDRLTVSISTDCGKTWSLRYIKTGSFLGTAPVTTGTFVPSATQWRTETVNLAPFWSYHNVRLRFDMLNGGGNDIYIDNINVASPSTGIKEFGALNSFNMYPNPTNGETFIDLSLSESSRLQVTVNDLTGRIVMPVADMNAGSGNQRVSFNAGSSLSPGLYMVTISAGNTVLTRKLLVN